MGAEPSCCIVGGAGGCVRCLQIPGPFRLFFSRRRTSSLLLGLEPSILLQELNFLLVCRDSGSAGPGKAC